MADGRWHAVFLTLVDRHPGACSGPRSMYLGNGEPDDVRGEDEGVVLEERSVHRLDEHVLFGEDIDSVGGRG